jgi:MFS family permease
VFVHDYATALVQRFAMGFFLGGVFGCAVSLYVGLFPPTVRGLLAGLVQLVYNGGDATLTWFGRYYAADSWQQVMVMGGVAAILAGVLVWLVVPNDRRIVPWGGHTYGAGTKVALSELFLHGRWKLTLRLAALCGLNFFAFQSFNGWVSSYLKEVHHYGADDVGKLLTILHVGSMTGAIVWGLAADRLGRRFNALGFVLAGALIVVYMLTPGVWWALAAAGFAYGFCLVCSGVWGPYFAELYPDHLRATAASIFNWGRIVSLFGALLSGAIAQQYGLQAAMYLGAITFFGAALLWWSLPETLRKDPVASR